MLCINLYLYFVSIEANCDKVITPQQEDLAVASSARRTSAVVRRSLSSVSQATKPMYDCNCLLLKHSLLPFSLSISLSSIRTNTNDLVYCHLQDFSTIPPLLSSYWRPIFHAEVKILRLFPFKGLRIPLQIFCREESLSCSSQFFWRRSRQAEMSLLVT